MKSVTLGCRIFNEFRVFGIGIQMMVLVLFAKDVVERSRYGLFLKFPVQLIFHHT